MMEIAIIGAGMAGLTLARELKDCASITIFEKSRGYGGRMATRQRGDFQFDHGAQFFTAKTPPFRKFLKPFIDQGTVARWDARFVEMDRNVVTDSRQWDDEYPHYVAQPGMNALCESMAQSLNIKLETRVVRIEKQSDRWQLLDGHGNHLAEVDWVITAIPAGQADELLPAGCSFKQELNEKPMLGCYSLMLGFEQPLSLPWDAALVKNADISWVCNNHTKPGRPEKPTLLVHATNRWAEENMELDDAAVIAHLQQETAAVTGMDLEHAVHTDLHRWRYANISKQWGDRSCLDTHMQLGAIGDWCVKGRIESAFQSGMHLAKQLRELI
ncbi:MAG: FAD-dependent oxidoreductase [Gammaproteobacteria bacterium]